MGIRSRDDLNRCLEELENTDYNPYEKLWIMERKGFPNEPLRKRLGIKLHVAFSMKDDHDLNEFLYISTRIKDGRTFSTEDKERFRQIFLKNRYIEILRSLSKRYNDDLKFTSGLRHLTLARIIHEKEGIVVEYHKDNRSRRVFSELTWLIRMGYAECDSGLPKRDKVRDYSTTYKITRKGKGLYDKIQRVVTKTLKLVS